MHQILTHVLLLVQVAVTQTLLYENTYKPIPGWMPKNATAAQVATVIHGAVDLAIWNSGSSAIEVRCSGCSPSPQLVHGLPDTCPAPGCEGMAESGAQR